jgi:site-specific recombinase XerD
MDEFMTPAMHLYLNGLSNGSRVAYLKKMETFIDFCESGASEGEEIVKVEDVMAFITSLHDDGFKTSTLWTSQSIILTFFDIGKGMNTNGVKKVIYRQLKLWEKDDLTKKAKVLSKIIEYYNKFTNVIIIQ